MPLLPAIEDYVDVDGDFVYYEPALHGLVLRQCHFRFPSSLQASSLKAQLRNGLRLRVFKSTALFHLART